MPSTYTTNNGIEKIGTGEQSGTWGDTTNLNFDILDQALDGQVTITATDTGSSGSPNTLPITDGTLSDGRNRLIIITDGGDLGGSVYYQLTPADAEKIIFLRNNLSGSQDLILFQGTYNASRDLIVPAGKDVIIKFSGGGTSNAVVAPVFADLNLDAATIASVDINGGTIDGVTIGTNAVATDIRVDNLQLDGNTLSSTDTDGNVVIAPNGDGDVQLDADTIRVGDSNTDVTITTNGTGDLTLNTNGGTNSGSIEIQDGANTNIIVTANGTGKLELANGDITTSAASGSDAAGQDLTIQAGASTGNAAGGDMIFQTTPAGAGSGSVLNSYTTVLTLTDDSKLQIGTSTAVDSILDEDDMTSDSATALATQQSIKAYVDSQVGTVDTWSEVLANGNTSGATDAVITAGQKITTDTIDETTADAGVTIDSVLLKDGGATLTGDLTVDTDTLYVDSTNNRVGIGEASPDVPLHVKSADNILAKLESTDATVTLDLIDDTSTGRIHQQASELRISSDPSNTVASSSVSFYVDGSEAARFDTGQRLLVGHTSSIQIGSQEAIVQVIGSGAGASSYSAVRYTNTANASKLTLGKSRATTLGGNTIVQDGDSVGIIDFAADDGNDINHQAASIQAAIDGTPGLNDVPGRLVFNTTSDGTQSPTERMRIDNAGLVTIGDGGGAITPLRISKTVSDTIDLDKTYNVAPKGAWLELHNPGGTTGGGVGISALGLGAEGRYAAIAMTDQTSDNSGTGGDIEFWTSASKTGALVEAMRIDKNGDVDIGQTGGGVKLAVAGAVGPQNGTAAAPTHTFYSDTDTGMYRAAANKLGFATGGSGALFIDSSQQTVLGTSSVRTTYSANTSSSGAKLAVEGTNADNTKIATVRNVDGVNGPYVVMGHSRGTSANAVNIVANDDHMGTLSFQGADGNVLQEGATIRTEVDGTPGVADMPGRLIFSTSADGASVPTERMRITQAGNVDIGFTRSDVNGKLNVSGNVGVRNFLATSNPTGGAFSFTDPDSSTILGILRVGDDDGSTSSVADLQIISYGSADDDGGGNIRFINSRYSKETGLIKSSRQSTNTGYMDFYTENGSGLQRALRIDSSQRVLIGTTTARSTAGHTANLQVEGSGSFSEATVSIVGNENNSNGAYLNFGKSRGTTAGSNTIVQDGDVSGQIQFTAADGTDMVSRVAAITAKVDGTPGANDTPGLLDFSTTADGASDPTLRMRIDNAGKVLIGTTTQNFSRLNFGQDEYIGFHSGNSSAGGLRFEDNSGYASAEIRFQGTGSNQAAAVVFSTGDSPGSENITEAMRIDSSQRVLIGLTSDIGTGHKLQLNSDMTIMTFDGTTTGANGVRYIKSRATSPGSNAIVANGDDVGFLDFRADDGTDYATRTAVISSGVDGTPGTNDMPGNIRFWTTADGASAVTERMRINNSGNVAIATTSFNMYQDGSNNYGANIYNTGQAAFSVNDSITVYSNRQNGDGTHITFRRDGAEKGVIGLIATDNLYIGSTTSGHSGLSFGTNEWTPMSPAGSNADDLVDIGAASRRIRKIYTSQGIFLGGTASANQLEDYEEGQWTPTLKGGTNVGGASYSARFGYYTKIGNIVQISCTVACTSVTGTGDMIIDGLPFTTGSGSIDSVFSFQWNACTWSGPSAEKQTVIPMLYQTNNTKIGFRASDYRSSYSHAQVQLIGSGAITYARITGTYRIGTT